MIIGGGGLKPGAARAASIVVMLLMLSRAGVVSAFPLDDAQQRCSAAFVKSSIKVLGVLGKESTRCLGLIGKGGGGGSDDVSTCVALDEKGKIAASAGKVDSAVAKYCSAVPYAMTCPEPCETLDDAGATTDIDDAPELTACLQCLNGATGGVGTDADPLRRGAYGAILKDASVPSDSTALKCESGILKSVGKLFQTKLKIVGKCLKDAYDEGALAPPESCIADLAIDSQVGAALAKLGTAVLKCTPPAPFDAGQCTGLDGSALADCLDAILECRTCRWVNGVIGGAVDCDAFDNGLLDASCLVP